ncbi:hypothetical protein R9X47_03240 [Wukongibacter baidiensis]|uniref:hypothetical protein n=1 Tax=Wukongibacter baidiensis TaxID=1723361 RepID=UPI003D7F8B03
MDKLLFIMISSCFIIIIVGQRVSAYKRENKAIAKSLRSLHLIEILLSIMWFFMAFSYLMMYMHYDIDYINETQDFYKLYTAILYALVGTSWLLRGVSKDFIDEHGIYTVGGKYKWHRVVSYKWGSKEHKKVRKKTIEYYDLTLIVKRGKLDRWILDEENKDVILEIASSDKAKVEKYLINVINKEKGSF